MIPNICSTCTQVRSNFPAQWRYMHAHGGVVWRRTPSQDLIPYALQLLKQNVRAGALAANVVWTYSWRFRFHGSLWTYSWWFRFHKSLWTSMQMISTAICHTCIRCHTCTLHRSHVSTVLASTVESTILFGPSFNGMHMFPFLSNELWRAMIMALCSRIFVQTGATHTPRQP